MERGNSGNSEGRIDIGEGTREETDRHSCMIRREGDYERTAGAIKEKDGKAKLELVGECRLG